MAWFVDWLTFKAPLICSHSVNDGSLVTVSRSGEVRYSVDKHLSVGSAYGNVMVRSVAGLLCVSGNPAKFFTGHNLWGSDAVHAQCVALVRDVCWRVGVSVTRADVDVWLRDGFKLSRIDCTRMFRLPPGSVPSWLQHAGRTAYGGRQGVRSRGEFKGRSVYVGESSKRVQLKFYDKGAELERHVPNVGPEGLGLLREYARDTLRVELMLRGEGLRDLGLVQSSAWSAEVGDAVLDDRLSRLSLSDNVPVDELDVERFPRPVRGAYFAWKHGLDLRSLYPSKSTFYRMRRALLACGVDISVPCALPVHDQVELPLGSSLKSFLAAPLRGLDDPALNVDLQLYAA